MKLKSILLGFFLFAAVCGSAQTFSISGRVTDATGGTPLSKATVFINNTTRGAVADENGYFTIGGLSSGTYELVISFVGYNALLTPIKISGKNYEGNFKLQLKQTELRELLIVNADTKQRYLDLFKKNLLGFTYDADKCMIKNINAVQFAKGKTNEDIVAYADEELEIDNPVLGYTIFFEIKDMHFNTVTTDCWFFGYTRYVDRMDKKNINKKWVRSRKNVYMGSLQHFLRSLVNKQLGKNGFIIYEVDAGLNSIQQHGGSLQNETRNGQLSTSAAGATADVKILQEENILKTGGTDEYRVYELLLRNQLLIKYSRNSDLKVQLSRTMYLPGQPELGTISGLRIKKTPAIVDYRGVLLTPMNIFVDGIWTSERLANMLPDDYMPE
jgi:CarboxypepD_reg-like domain